MQRGRLEDASRKHGIVNSALKINFGEERILENFTPIAKLREATSYSNIDIIKWKESAGARQQVAVDLDKDLRETATALFRCHRRLVESFNVTLNSGASHSLLNEVYLGEEIRGENRENTKP